MENPDSTHDLSTFTGVPSRRATVRHTHEAVRNPLGPRSFIPAKLTRDPIEFARATEMLAFWWCQPPLLYEHHYSYRGDRPYTFYSQPLAASRKNHTISACTMLADSGKSIPVSQVPIFTLPEASVQNILFYLDHSDLAAFAHVDRDCLQLARACLFRNVLINYSSASMALLEKLVNEGCYRATNKFSHYQPRWTLGACIRRISVVTEPDSKETNYKPTCWIDAKIRYYDAVAYHERHMNFLELALRVALPNVEFLEWWDLTPISPVMVHAIVKSRITRLELHCVRLSEDFNVCGRTESERRMMYTHEWRLQRLVLDVAVDSLIPSCAPIFSASLLKLAASSLEELIWTGTLFTIDRRHDSHSFGTDPVSFKRLKKLHMLRVPLADDTVLSALLPSDGALQLSNLLLDSPEPKLAPFFANRHIPTLKHLNWSVVAPFDDVDQFVSFVEANPQLETFRTTDRTPKLLHECLLPLFASSFLSLTSVSLVFATAAIVPASLALIGTIATLTHLWLGAGVQRSVSFDWFVDHDSLRDSLASLKQLEWFALTLDLYPNGNKHSVYQHPPKSQKWENGHIRLMARHAMEFAKSHPKLTWVYFGDVPMEMERAQDGTGEIVDAVPLVEKRQDCETLLQEMWGADFADWDYQT